MRESIRKMLGSTSAPPPNQVQGRCRSGAETLRNARPDSIDWIVAPGGSDAMSCSSTARHCMDCAMHRVECHFPRSLQRARRTLPISSVIVFGSMDRFFVESSLSNSAAMNLVHSCLVILPFLSVFIRSRISFPSMPSNPNGIDRRVDYVISSRGPSGKRMALPNILIQPVWRLNESGLYSDGQLHRLSFP